MSFSTFNLFEFGSSDMNLRRVVNESGCTRNQHDLSWATAEMGREPDGRKSIFKVFNELKMWLMMVILLVYQNLCHLKQLLLLLLCVVVAVVVVVGEDLDHQH